MVRRITILVIVVFFLSVAQGAIVLYETHHLLDVPKLQTAVTNGYVSMCINHLPVANNTCPPRVNQSTAIVNNNITCYLGGNDPDGNPVNYTNASYNASGFLFQMDSRGYASFWANQTGIGLYYYNATLKEINQSCATSYTSNSVFTLWVDDINDPPFLRRDIPPKKLSPGSSLSAFFLRDYFGDPDQGDRLSYNYSLFGNVQSMNVSIDPANSQVILTSPAGFCGYNYFIFTATDEGNLSTDSNAVQFESVCYQNTPAGAAGGAGGGSLKCEPEWQCERWSQCLPNSSRYRRCVDLKGCDSKTIEKFFWEHCDYINQTEEKPPANESPKEIVISCHDGIKNQGEIGVDCGGPCPPCPIVEVPTLIPPKESNILSILIVILSILAVLFLTYVVFRREINRLLAKIGWLLTKKRKQQYLLTEPEKQMLMAQIAKLDHEVAVRKGTPFFRTEGELVQETLRLARLYIKTALRMEFEFTPTDLERQATRVLLHESLKQVFRLLLKRQLLLETAKINISRVHLATMIEELRQMVLNTSKTTKDDYTFISKEIPITGDTLERLSRLMYNAMNALQYREIAFTQDRYLRILELYEQLEEDKKALIYDDIARLYNEIRYVLAWHK